MHVIVINEMKLRSIIAEILPKASLVERRARKARSRYESWPIADILAWRNKDIIGASAGSTRRALRLRAEMLRQSTGGYKTKYGRRVRRRYGSAGSK